LYNSDKYETGQVTDKAGSGDCFMAGPIFGFYNDLEPIKPWDLLHRQHLKNYLLKAVTTKTIKDQ